MSTEDVVIVLDTETTGLEPDKGAEIIEVAIRYGLEDDTESKLWKIKPLADMTEESIAVHGITNAMAADWPTFGEVADDIAANIRRANVIVGWNPDFDIRMLMAEFQRAGMNVRFNHTVVCGMRLWDIQRPRPKRDLTAGYAQFVDPTAPLANAHGALVDARATAQVVRAQLAAFGLQGARWDSLDPDRATWWGPSKHVIWKDGVLVCNFGKNEGTPMHMLDGGMLRWIAREDFPRHVKDLCARLGAIPAKTPDDITCGILCDWAENY